MMEIKNAVIKSITMSNDDHGCLTIWVNLDYGGVNQGFGGYSLYSPNSKQSGNYAGLFIWRILEIVDVNNWDNIIGKTIRVKSDHSGVEAIGHILKDDWFNPKLEFEALIKC